MSDITVRIESDTPLVDPAQNVPEPADLLSEQLATHEAQIQSIRESCKVYEQSLQRMEEQILLLKQQSQIISDFLHLESRPTVTRRRPYP